MFSSVETSIYRVSKNTGNTNYVDLSRLKKHWKIQNMSIIASRKRLKKQKPFTRNLGNMSEIKFKDRYRIPSARASWHDYLGGAYFVTICTKDRGFYFGKINEEQMCLSEIGRYADEQFRDVSLNYPYAEIPVYVVMPNHIHAIVFINDRRDTCRDAIHRVSGPELPVESNKERGGVTGNNNPMLYRSLGTVIRGLKARVTHYANEKGIEFAWQSRFHDRIIRDQKDLNETALYVEKNVVKWPEDEMNS